jgi:hypothetical protein
MPLKQERWPDPVRDSGGQHDRRSAVVSRELVALPVRCISLRKSKNQAPVPRQFWSCRMLVAPDRVERVLLGSGSYRPECQRHGGSKTRGWGLLEARRILNPMPAWRNSQSKSTSGALVILQKVG